MKPETSIKEVERPLDGRRVHILKTLPRYWHALTDGTKTFEVRRDDRGYAEGDVLVLRLYDPTQSTYCEMRPDRCTWTHHRQQHAREDFVVEVTYVMPGGLFGVDERHVVLGFRPVDG